MEMETDSDSDSVEGKLITCPNEEQVHELHTNTSSLSDSDSSVEGKLIACPNEEQVQELHANTSSLSDSDSSVEGKLIACPNEEQVHEPHANTISLPDHIIINILSRLPTKDAVNTFLTPPFGNLRTSTYNIDLDGCSFHQCEDYKYPNHLDPSCNPRFVRFVRNVLLRHQCYNIERFRLRFEFHLDTKIGSMCGCPLLRDALLEEHGMAKEIASWIQFAVRRSVKVLELDFLACQWLLYLSSYAIRLPRGVLSSDTITELRLVFCNLPSPEVIRMSSLKILYLKEISVEDSMMERILSGCPLLESLSLEHCGRLFMLRHTAQNLKHLSIFFRMEGMRCWDDFEEKLKIFCPYVKSLEISGCIDRLDVEDLSSVVDASFRLTADDEPAMPDKFREILAKLHRAQVLALCEQSIEALSKLELTSQQCPFANVESLVLETVLGKVQLPGIARLLINSPKLKDLTVHTGLLDPTFSPNNDRLLEMHGATDDSHLHSQPLNQLKKIAIHGYSSIEPSHAQLVEFLLRNAVVLEEMTIHTYGVTRSGLRSLHTLLKRCKASINAVTTVKL